MPFLCIPNRLYIAQIFSKVIALPSLFPYSSFILSASSRLARDCLGFFILISYTFYKCKKYYYKSEIIIEQFFDIDFQVKVSEHFSTL